AARVAICTSTDSGTVIDPCGPSRTRLTRGPALLDMAGARHCDGTETDVPQAGSCDGGSELGQRRRGVAAARELVAAHDGQREVARRRHALDRRLLERALHPRERGGAVAIPDDELREQRVV